LFMVGIGCTLFEYRSFGIYWILFTF
jgi:hypothetical protein